MTMETFLICTMQSVVWIGFATCRLCQGQASAYKGVRLSCISYINQILPGIEGDRQHWQTSAKHCTKEIRQFKQIAKELSWQLSGSPWRTKVKSMRAAVRTRLLLQDKPHQFVLWPLTCLSTVRIPHRCLQSSTAWRHQQHRHQEPEHLHRCKWYQQDSESEDTVEIRGRFLRLRKLRCISNVLTCSLFIIYRSGVSSIKGEC